MEPDLIGQEKLKPGSVIARGIPPQWSLTSSVRKSSQRLGNTQLTLEAAVVAVRRPPGKAPFPYSPPFRSRGRNGA